MIDAGVTPRELSAVRIYGAALLLFVVVAPHLRALTRNDMLHLIPFALAGFVAGQGLYFQAISRVDIAVVLVIVFTAPLVVALYQRLVHSESLPRYAYGAMAVAVLALAVLGSGDVGSLSLLGIGLAVLTMVAYSATVLMAETAEDGASTARPYGDGTRNRRLRLARDGAAVDASLRSPRREDDLRWPRRVSLPVWTAVVFVVVIGTVAVYATWVAGASLVGVGAASVVGMAEPMLGAILAWALLAQSLTAVQSIGIATTAAGIIVVEQARVRSTRDGIRDVPIDL